MDKIILYMELQKLRHRLHEVAETRGSLTDPEVIAISEEADEVIVALQRIKKNENLLKP
ncbi:Spo0E family sporulation regulatory protein-aspartic acid phosphatase [Paenibacillus sp. GCM10012307]|uniref:Aspartyl-phosphate phosphatase Spo0E family protein n=1 Tax=Paenibacillus roseus TaxID=2798579 RepID=A0A934IWV6_9BACL|nr:aspartyl-phosphate phosphatase Spo0E family protein [Paenibacillus roseus]MBJ6360781.1 aspartyl-phosphate phosphatase Spo0E family protein [Paenibacillus roseus]